jgi:inositol-phosphate transport system substrate-binding protein
MSILTTLKCMTAAAAILASTTGLSFSPRISPSACGRAAQDPNDVYRLDAIDIAAQQLQREAAIKGEDLKIKVEKKPYSGWEDFKQALTLAAEAKTAPNIVVTGHEDIGPWAQAGLIVPIEDYVDLDSWPLNDIYENLMQIASFNGTSMAFRRTPSPARCSSGSPT